MSRDILTDARFRILRRDLRRAQRRAQVRQKAGQVLSTLGYLIVVAAVVIVLLSL